VRGSLSKCEHPRDAFCTHSYRLKLHPRPGMKCSYFLCRVRRFRVWSMSADFFDAQPSSSTFSCKVPESRLTSRFRRSELSVVIFLSFSALPSSRSAPGVHVTVVIWQLAQLVNCAASKLASEKLFAYKCVQNFLYLEM
jgi:hypothetical protein